MSYDVARVPDARTQRARMRRLMMRRQINPGLGFSLNPFTIATDIQNAANRVTSGLTTVATDLQAIKNRVTTGFDAITGMALTTGQVAQSVSRSAIATAASGNSGTGLLAAAGSTQLPLVLAGLGAAVFLLMRRR